MNTLHLRAFSVVAGLLLLVGCGGGGGGNDVPLVAYSCAVPCLATVPTVSTNTIGSDGGTVTVRIVITDVTTVTGMSIGLDAVAPYTPWAGGENLAGHFASNVIDVEFAIPSGTVPGTYYPYVRILSDSGEAEYNFDDRVSATNYQYAQTVRTTGDTTYALAPFAMPLVTIAE